MTTPEIFAVSLGTIASPLIVKGRVLFRLGRLVKWIMTVWSPSNVAPLRLSHCMALSIMAWIPSRFASADGPVTHASYRIN
jgi:hypothetical protein